MPTVAIHAMRVKRDTQPLLSRTRMTLTPDLALAYVKELSADYRSGAILTAEGAFLAGDEALARAARAIAGWSEATAHEPGGAAGAAGTAGPGSAAGTGASGGG